MRTAEFVSPKHPDKICDIISDTILDCYLEKDSESKCAIETMGGHGKVWISGEISSNANIDNEQIIDIVNKVSGVTDVTINIKNQSEVFQKNLLDGNSSDQCTVIGFAITETPNRIPFEYEFARGLNKFIYQYYPYDGKTQVTINGNHARVVASFQNSKTSHLSELIDQYFKENSCKVALQEFKITEKFCNPLGEWSVGGFDVDTGISGRKNVLDSYGPRVPTGGVSFSGKDGSKIDRCASYMARKIAIDYLNKHRLMYCMVELSYSIGSNEPIIKRVKGNDQGVQYETGIKLYEVEGYDLKPQSIINLLDLKKPQFAKLSQWGHFGNGCIWDL